MPRTTPTIQTRWLIRRDLLEVLAIEKASYAEAWEEEHFLAALRERNCIGITATDRKEAVVGYMIYQMHKRYFRLLNLAVMPGYRRRGVGRALIERVQHNCCPECRTRIEVTVNERDMDAQRFLKAMEFLAVKLERGLFSDGDGIAFRWRCEW